MVARERSATTKRQRKPVARTYPVTDRAAARPRNNATDQEAAKKAPKTNAFDHPVRWR
jgi:hypothetical protein